MECSKCQRKTRIDGLIWLLQNDLKVIGDEITSQFLTLVRGYRYKAFFVKICERNKITNRVIGRLKKIEYELNIPIKILYKENDKMTIKKLNDIKL